MKTQNELNIFKTMNIEVLKSLYYKSKAFLIENRSLEVETDCLAKASRYFRESPIIRKSLKKIGNELKIFKKASIETLKSSYNESIGIV
jgi:hypothetical protein